MIIWRKQKIVPELLFYPSLEQTSKKLNYVHYERTEVGADDVLPNNLSGQQTDYSHHWTK